MNAIPTAFEEIPHSPGYWAHFSAPGHPAVYAIIPRACITQETHAEYPYRLHLMAVVQHSDGAWTVMEPPHSAVARWVKISDIPREYMSHMGANLAPMQWQDAGEVNDNGDAAPDSTDDDDA